MFHYSNIKYIILNSLIEQLLAAKIGEDTYDIY